MNGIVTTTGTFADDAERMAFLAAIPAAVPAVKTLADVQRSQGALLAAACQAAIYAGFISSALGAAHTYPAKDRDQNNLAASVLASILPGIPAGWTTPLWCVDAAGVWAYVPHTAAQVQQVGIDGKAAIVACLLRNQALATQVMAIQDTSAAGIAAVQAIVW